MTVVTPGRPAGGAIRVIAGSARGVMLRGPRSEGTRPTTSRLRESLFAMLESAGVDFSRVLDLYAGSGALGIEALSRGEGRATFVEADHRAAATIRENLERARLAERGEVVVARVGRWRAPAGVAYTLVVADPPYHDATSWAAIEASVEDALEAEATVAVEHDARQPPPPAFAGRPLWRQRRQGDGAVAIYQPHSPAGEDST
ncbi:MAG: 16S rRNA (guanine(966)-N(2))-methyltransferase RsmD [Dehalococcoidia bacterium]